MSESNLMVISNSFPNKDNTFLGDIFVKEQLKFIKDYFDNVYVVSPVAYGMEHLRKTKHSDYQFDNVYVYFPKYANSPLFWRNWKTMWIHLEAKVIKSLISKKNLHFDLIHAHFTWPSGAVAVRLKKSIGTPVVITEHGVLTWFEALKNEDKHYINTWNDSDAIIRVNKNDVPLICRYCNDPSKVYSIGNGYDPSKYHPIDMGKARRSLGLPIDSKIVLNISRLHEVKGQNHLISSIGYIVNVRKDVVCYIGGIGPFKEDLKKHISSSNLHDNVKLLGFVPDSKMNNLINSCDLFVLPSLSESFGIVQIEAMACGKPVIATRNGGSEEVITSKEYGLLVDPANSEDLAEKILVALDRVWDHKKILAYAEQYRWVNVAKEIVDVYEQVLK